VRQRPLDVWPRRTAQVNSGPVGAANPVESGRRRTPSTARFRDVRLRRPAPVAGRYLLLEEIGRGATGTVHRARDLRSRREVAAKVVRGRDPGALVELVREVGHRIEHPHVLTPLGWAAEDDVALVAMELVAGGSLRDLLNRRGPVPETLAALLLGQLLDALAAVHERGIVHGDVKPANLLVRDGVRPHLLLSDFGVSATAGSLAPVAGTPAFLAPERRAGAAPDPSQDVYAAGLVARRILAGPSPLLTLADSMTRPEPERRPTAAAARHRLAELCPRRLVG
jgi:eukaryotic-like serine/threonine-protein kinase